MTADLAQWHWPAASTGMGTTGASKRASADDVHDDRGPLGVARSGEPRPEIYILHGFGEHMGRYQRLIKHLNALGFDVAGHDHRGHGRSPGEPGVLPPGPSMADDAQALLAASARRTGVAPVLFGHSMGGVLAAELVLQHQVPVSGLVLSSPGLRPALNAWQYVQLRMLEMVAPDWVVARPVDGNRLSHDPEQVKAYHEDPLVHGQISASMVLWMRRSGAASIAAASALDRPTMLLGGAADQVVDPQAWHDLIASAPSDIMSVLIADDARHEVFNELGSPREQALACLDNWLMKHFGWAVSSPVMQPSETVL